VACSSPASIGRAPQAFEVCPASGHSGSVGGPELRRRGARPGPHTRPRWARRARALGAQRPGRPGIPATWHAARDGGLARRPTVVVGRSAPEPEPGPPPGIASLLRTGTLGLPQPASLRVSGPPAPGAGGKPGVSRPLQVCFPWSQHRGASSLRHAAVTPPTGCYTVTAQPIIATYGAPSDAIDSDASSTVTPSPPRFGRQAHIPRCRRR
jgi:hypothetical protein